MGEMVSLKLSKVRLRDVARESLAVVRHRDVAQQVVDVAVPGLLVAVASGKVFGMTSFWEGTLTVGVTVAAMLTVPTIRFLRGLPPALHRLYEQQSQSILAAKDAEWGEKLRALKQEHDNMLWANQYGGVRPELSMRYRIGPAAVASIEKLYNLADTACGQCFALLASWSQRLREERRESSDAWLAEFVDAIIVKPGVSALGALRQEIVPLTPDYRDSDERHSLIGLYQRYHEAREWLFRFARILDIDVAQHTQYRTWRAADERFDRELREALNQHSLRDVRDHIAAVDRGGGFPVAEPTRGN